MQTPETTDFEAVIQCLNQYFEGLHNADVTLLSSIFHDDAVLKAPGLRRDKQTWLEAVSNRNIPAQLNHGYHYRILSVEVVADQAMAKVYCPLLGRHYIDFLGLLKEDGHWQIVNKMYTDSPDHSTDSNT